MSTSSVDGLLSFLLPGGSWCWPSWFQRREGRSRTQSKSRVTSCFHFSSALTWPCLRIQSNTCVCLFMCAVLQGEEGRPGLDGDRGLQVIFMLCSLFTKTAFQTKQSCHFRVLELARMKEKRASLVFVIRLNLYTDRCFYYLFNFWSSGSRRNPRPSRREGEYKLF